MEIWKILNFELLQDTAGQERFRTLIPSYYRDACGAILVYDISKMSSFQKTSSWIDELETNTNRNIVKMIVGNKIDLPQNERTVSRESGKKFAKQQRALFVETSAANNVNVQMAFEELVKKILEENIFDDHNEMMRSDIRLGQEPDNRQPSGGSCGGYCR